MVTQQSAGASCQPPPGSPGDDHQDLRRDEVILGSSEIGRCTCKALQAVARAARAFLFYDAQNDAIRAFLEELQQQMQEALRLGAMELTIRPWTMLRGDEEVYKEQDRERSLAFRLYRDGVRKLTIQPAVTWDELVKLLGVFSVRYTGVRQQEDDIVTLLWRARFEHIQVITVKGFEAARDEAEELAADDDDEHPLSPQQQAIFDSPYHFDYPWPERVRPAKVAARPVDPARLRLLQREDQAVALPGQSVQLVRELLQVCSDPISEIELDSLLAMLRDIRTYLLEQALFDELLGLLRICIEAPLAREGAIPRPAVLQVFTEQRTVEQLVEAVLQVAETPAAVKELLGLLPPPVLATILGQLHERWEGAARTFGMELVAATAAARIEPIVALAHQASGPMAADLLRAFARHHQQHAVALALTHLARDYHEAKLVGLAILKRAPYHADIGTVLLTLLDDDAEEVRTSAAILLAMNLERRAYEVIITGIEHRGPGNLSTKEGEAMGMALAKLEPRKALSLFREWARPGGLLGALKPGRQQLCWAAVCGLALLPGPSSEEIVKGVRKKAEGELAQRCAQTLAILQRYSRRGSR